MRGGLHIAGLCGPLGGRYKVRVGRCRRWGQLVVARTIRAGERMRLDVRGRGGQRARTRSLAQPVAVRRRRISTGPAQLVEAQLDRMQQGASTSPQLLADTVEVLGDRRVVHCDDKGTAGASRPQSVLIAARHEACSRVAFPTRCIYLMQLGFRSGIAPRSADV